jgi:hypothetical protein
MARNRVWDASTLVGLEAPAAPDHGGLFYHGSHHDPDRVAVGQIGPH